MNRAGALSTLLLALISFVAPASAQQVVPRWDCCAHIYSTGRWLGWAGALLDYTREWDGPSPVDNVIISNLRNAGLSCQSANDACSSEVEAWPAWQAKQLWLASEIKRLQSTVYHKLKRYEVTGQINTAYGVWGGELARYRYRAGNLDRVENRPTCAMYYFQIGFDTAYATQAYRHAQEALNFGRQQDALQQMARAINHLRRAMNAFAGLAALERSPPPGMVCSPLVSRTQFPQAIQLIINSGPMDLSKLPAATQASGLVSDRIGNFLLQNCPRAALTPPPQFPADHSQDPPGPIQSWPPVFPSQQPGPQPSVTPPPVVTPPLTMSPTGGWAGTWIVESTHLSGPTRNRSFRSRMNVTVSNGGCRVTLGDSSVSDCSMSGNTLTFTGKHPSGGRMTWRFVRNQDRLTGSFSGMIGNVAAHGTYVGSRAGR